MTRKRGVDPSKVLFDVIKAGPEFGAEWVDRPIPAHLKPQELLHFLGEYQNYVTNVLQPTRDEVRKLLQSWTEPGYWRRDEAPQQRRLPSPSPIRRTYSRIKRPESVVDKIVRKPDDFPHGLSAISFRQMNDTLGVRVVVYFLSGLPLVDRELGNIKQLEISEKDPPVAYLNEDLTKRFSLTHRDRREKESGYASIHYTVRFRESAILGGENPWFELQLRTLTEDLWGEIEHILGYKPGKRTSFAVRKQFQLLSSQLITIDQHFNFLYEELSRFQQEIEYSDTDPLNAENLPPVLSDIGLSCAQQEIDGLLKLLFSRKVETIKDLRGIMTERHQEVIRNTYRNKLGRAPENFETIATAAALHGADIEQEKELIEAQIQLWEAWYSLKQGLPQNRPATP